MTTAVLLGLLPNPMSAESAVNNLVEAGISERKISLMLQDTATARAIIDDAGPLQGVTMADIPAALAALGVEARAASAYAAGMESGKALLAIRLSSRFLDGAGEVLRDNGGDLLESVPAGGSK